MEFSQRYVRSRDSVTAEEQARLAEARVLVAGCGGLGGYILEALARVGVGHITAVDGDVFDQTNLNRQLLCTEQNLGCNKAHEAKKRLLAIDSSLDVTAVEEHLDAWNVHRLAEGNQVVIDALDAPIPRRLLLDAAMELGIPFIHGAISGWVARVHTAMPGDTITRSLFEQRGVEDRWGNLPFTAAVCGALQAAEAVKVLLDKGDVTQDRSLECDLLHMSFDAVLF